ncbi:MAG: chalcone isomerase family protein [Moritella sp.]|uniref:chalcone isomerase family protein n=1 Tax=Moritella sp. TaxID=78556 RepID=UPI0029BAB549|nr:chalcone isomerase family protein [Moritella sp.]MDX2319835.1 chalcone isomerase family protein [Moritella sp.]
MTKSKAVLTQINLILLAVSLIFTATSVYASNDPTQQFKKIGQGEMSWLFFDLYHASLYSESGDYRSQGYPQALKIIYKRDIYSDDLVDVTEKEWLKLGLTPETYQEWLPVLLTMWPDIKDGDELVFLVQADGRGYFYHNNLVLGGIDSHEFSSAFLAIWLSENTSEPGLRRQLIGE